MGQFLSAELVKQDEEGNWIVVNDVTQIKFRPF